MPVVSIRFAPDEFAELKVRKKQAGADSVSTYVRTLLGFGMARGAEFYDLGPAGEIEDTHSLIKVVVSQGELLERILTILRGAYPGAKEKSHNMELKEKKYAKPEGFTR